ncbi:Bestrophin-2, partial [Orchesella cincta]
SYTAEVATCKGFGCFLKLLFRWRGSIYKLVWPDLFLFLGTYFSLSILYRFFLNVDQKLVFAQIVRYCEKYGNLIPVSFVLGFYVSIVVGRWWDQYKSIPWPDSIAVFVSANIQGQEEKGRVMRRTIMRYCCLSLTMAFTLISPRVKKRFPTLDHLIEAGLLLENEKEIIEELNRIVPGYSKQWLPVVWAASIVTRARKEGKIRDDFAVKTILDELNKFRSGCGILISYDWISVPLVYTQVVTLAVYSYFLSCVMGRQWVDPDSTLGEKHEVDLVFPIFTTLQFFFYMGWLKVAESLVNPFGDDDDDFELNWMVDRNLQVSYLIVDEMHNNHPELLRDQYWDEVFPTELPHTVASEMYRDEPPLPSTANIHVSKDDGEIISPPSVKSIFHMSESGIFMRSSTKPKIAVTPDEEMLTMTADDGGDTLSFHHHNVLCKGHTHLARAVHSYPVRMDDHAVVGNLMYGPHHESNGEVETGDGNDDDERPSTASPPSSRRRHHSSEPGRRVSVAASKRGSIVGRRERTASVRSTASQSTLAESISGRLSHAGSVTSVFRRMFSRDRGEKTSELNSPVEGSTAWAGSAINMQRNVAEDVIPELDENMTTIISMRGERKPPTVHDIFGTSPTSTAPVDIPSQGEGSQKSQLDTAAAREQFFQGQQRPERPTQLSVSAPPRSEQLDVPPGIGQGSNSPGTQLTSTDTSATVSPETGIHSDSKSDNSSDDGIDADESMDDMHVNNRKHSGDSTQGASLAKKLAKTFGFKDKDKGEQDKAEVHLLSDVSRIKEDSEEEEDGDEEDPADGKKKDDK